MGKLYKCCSQTSSIKAQVDQLGGRLRKQHKPFQMHNLAFPGATAQDDLSDQLSRFFTLFPKHRLCGLNHL